MGGGPVVVVADDDELVTSLEQFLAVEYAGTYAVVVDDGPAVAPCHHDGVLGAAAAVALFEGVDEFAAWYEGDVGHETKAGERVGELLADEVAQRGGVPQYARVLDLAHHLGEGVAADGEPVDFQFLWVEGRTQLLAHGRELGCVANEHETAARTCVDVVYEVVEQTSGAEHAACRSLATYHRSFVDDEKGSAQLVGRLFEAYHLGREALLPIDFAMDGVGRCLCVVAEHLGCTARGSKEHDGSVQEAERLDECPYEGGFSGSGIAREKEKFVASWSKEEIDPLFHHFSLLRSGVVGEISED